MIKATFSKIFQNIFMFSLDDVKNLFIEIKTNNDCNLNFISNVNSDDNV